MRTLAVGSGGNARTARRGRWVRWLALSVLAAGMASGAETGATGKDLEPAELATVQQELFAKLGLAFLRGSAQDVMALFEPPRDEAAREWCRDMLESLQQEFQNERYLTFAVPVRIENNGVLNGPGRYSVWARLRVTVAAREKGLPVMPAGAAVIREVLESGGIQLRLSGTESLATTGREVTFNGPFIVKRYSDGRWQFLAVPFLATLGHRQGGDLVADALLWALAALAGLAFWVWMGCEAFQLRPRSVGWRLSVVAVPLLGALCFFAWKYVPSLRRPASRPLTV